MNRRNFIQALMGAAVLPTARKIYVFAPPSGWNLGAEESFVYSPLDKPTHWAYRYVYRNVMTGCVSALAPDLWSTPLTKELVNCPTFGMNAMREPEQEVVDIYRRLPGETGFFYWKTQEGSQ